MQLTQFTDYSLRILLYLAHHPPQDGERLPAVLDISRYWLDAQFADPQAQLLVNWLPNKSAEQLDLELQQLGATSPLKLLRQELPERLARALCEQAGIDAVAPAHQLTRDRRKALVRLVCAQPLPITGNRGWNVADGRIGGYNFQWAWASGFVVGSSI